MLSEIIYITVIINNLIQINGNYFLFHDNYQVSKYQYKLFIL